MALTHITTHAADAVARLLSQYRDKAKLAALVSRLATRAQALEDAVWAMLAQLVLATAADAWLDRLGGIVGEAREGRLDVVFRAAIQARILANQSSGRVEDVIEVFQAWVAWWASNPPIHVTQLAPAALSVETSPTGDAISANEADLLPLFRIFAATRAAGVGMTVRYQLSADVDGMFTFADGTPEASTDQGFSDNDPNGTGGHWAGAVRC